MSIHDEEGLLVAHRVKNVVQDLFFPEILICWEAVGNDQTSSPSKRAETASEQVQAWRDNARGANTLLIPGREYNNLMLSNPIAVAIDQSESYKTLKVRNQHVDPTLSIGDFSVLIRGRRFTLLSYGRLCFP